MPLHGNLKTVSLSSVLQLLCTEKQTGVLRVSNNIIEYQMIINEGDIIYAIQSSKKDRLGVLLAQEGYLSKEEIQESLELAKQKKVALGKVLVQKGLITSDVLKKFIYKQVEEILFDAFVWEDGEFDFKETSLNLKWLVVVKLNIMKLLLDASRRIDVMSVLKKSIPSDLIVFKVSDKSEINKDKKLNSDELKVLSLIDGSRSVRDIINRGEVDPFILYKILYSFISTGLIKEHDRKKAVDS